MEKNVKENASFYALGIIAIIIAVLGITANTIYSHSGGYALGAGLVAVAFLFECFIFSISPKLVKTRTKGILFFTAAILVIYTILFIFGDLAKVIVYKSIYEDGAFVSKLQSFGVFALVFEVFCLILTVFFVLRMGLNLFGKEFKLYEKILGTNVLRYKERENVVMDVPPKDTEKLIASAKRSLGHDDKLTKAIENAKPEEVELKHKKHVVHSENLRIENTDKENIPDKNIRNIRESVSSDNSKNGQAELVNKIIDESPVSPETVQYENEYDLTENDTQISNETEDIQAETADTPIQNSDIIVVSEDETITSDDNAVFDEYNQNNNVVDESDKNTQEDETAYDICGTGELYADAHDVGGVLSGIDIQEDIRIDGISNRITEQVDSPDDDIYALFDYDSEDE